MNNLVKCKACGKEIAKGVKKCPNCGKDQRNFFFRHKIISIIGIIVILGIIGSIGGKKPSTDTNTSTTEAKQEAKEEVIQVSAADLAKAYEDNEVNADKS